jgi:3-deoxy-manno-octulosonate cytidylyltransferase (CMP-KDO synthetase)
LSVTEHSKFLIAIPARRASTRLPDKLLLDLTGKPLLAHSIERARDAAARLKTGNGISASVVVVCDDEKLAKAAQAADCRPVMTGSCDSGTERIVAALPDLPGAEVVVNLQADEPEMPIEWILAANDAFDTARQADVVTIAVGLLDGEAAVEDPNVVKVVLDHKGYAMYFSRATIPVVRSGGRAPQPRALAHVGLYAYRREFLERYRQLPASELEAAECLEQLRFLQAGARIKVLVRTDRERHARGIDTEADYREFVQRHQAWASRNQA